MGRFGHPLAPDAVRIALRPAVPVVEHRAQALLPWRALAAAALARSRLCALW